jgi:hypothetical protein
MKSKAMHHPPKDGFSPGLNALSDHGGVSALNHTDASGGGRGVRTNCYPVATACSNLARRSWRRLITTDWALTMFSYCCRALNTETRWRCTRVGRVRPTHVLPTEQHFDQWWVQKYRRLQDREPIHCFDGSIIVNINESRLRGFAVLFNGPPVWSTLW